MPETVDTPSARQNAQEFVKQIVRGFEETHQIHFHDLLAGQLSDLVGPYTDFNEYSFGDPKDETDLGLFKAQLKAFMEVFPQRGLPLIGDNARDKFYAYVLDVITAAQAIPDLEGRALPDVLDEIVASVHAKVQAANAPAVRK